MGTLLPMSDNAHARTKLTMLRRVAGTYWKASLRLALLVGLAGSYGRAQATNEYGGVVATAGIRAGPVQLPKALPGVLPQAQNKSGSVHLPTPTHPAED